MPEGGKLTDSKNVERSPVDRAVDFSRHQYISIHFSRQARPRRRPAPCKKTDGWKDESCFCEDSSGIVNLDSVVMVNRETFVVVNRNSQLRVNRFFGGDVRF